MTTQDTNQPYVTVPYICTLEDRLETIRKNISKIKPTMTQRQMLYYLRDIEFQVDEIYVIFGLLEPRTKYPLPHDPRI